jgi:hypothetical protein
MRSLILTHDATNPLVRTLGEGGTGIHFRRYPDVMGATSTFLEEQGSFPPGFVERFWSEARIPTFGSPPEGWMRLAELLGTTGSAGVLAAILTGPSGDPIQLLLVGPRGHRHDPSHTEPPRVYRRLGSLSPAVRLGSSLRW